MSGILAKIGGAILLVLALLGAGTGLGWWMRGGQVETAQNATLKLQAAWDAEKIASAQQIQKIQADAQALVDAAEKKAQDARAKEIIHEKTVTEYVDRVVSVLDAHLPWGFVCAHDAAAGGDCSALAAPPCDAPGATSPYSEADALAAIDANYGRGDDCCSRLVAFQQWYAQLRATQNAQAANAK